MWKNRSWTLSDSRDAQGLERKSLVSTEAQLYPSEGNSSGRPWDTMPGGPPHLCLVLGGSSITPIPLGCPVGVDLPTPEIHSVQYSSGYTHVTHPPSQKAGKAFRSLCNTEHCEPI